METTYFIFSIIFGLIVGSFLNVCIYRIPREESIAYPPSHCTNCGYKLRWYDLIPVISYILLKGRCRSCRQRISIIYPIIEIMTATLFGLLYLKFGISISFFKYAVLFCFLIVIGTIDYLTQDVYFNTTLTGILFGIFFVILEKYYLNIPLKNSILGGLLGALFIGAIVFLTKAMGEGDIEICLLCGIYLGFINTFLMLLLSFIIGGVVGVLLILFKVKGRKDYIPFGPFISLATIIVVLFGDLIFNWYISLF